MLIHRNIQDTMLILKQKYPGYNADLKQKYPGYNADSNTEISRIQFLF